MRILFLCGSLEPGKDGVGDYTRRIAGQLGSRGGTVGIIAMNDPFVGQVQEQYQVDNNYPIQVLRIPSSYSQKNRKELVRGYSKSFDPDWMSLQFVLYAFHFKGLPISWLSLFRNIRGTFRWHIMFHELWIGSKSYDSLKYRIIGIGQRFIVRRLLNILKPLSVTTNLTYYQKLLRRLGCHSSVLPVFSNIPLWKGTNQNMRFELPNHVVRDRGRWLVAAMFGGLSNTADIQQHFDDLVNRLTNENKKLFLFHLGKAGAGISLLQYIKDRQLCEVVVLGEQLAESISPILQLADFGISTYDAAFLEKSGSIAALLNNRLPVVLLKETDVTLANYYTYAKSVKAIASISSFCNQSTEWSSLFGLNSAAIFYEQTFQKKV